MTEEKMDSILYVEDQAQYGEIIRRLHGTVSKKFYDQVEFHVVETWNDMLESIDKKRPSVILLDLGLGQGWTETESIIALGASWEKLPPVMVLTGNKYDLTLRRKCILAGASDFMIKDDANHHPELLCERLYHCFLRRLRHDARA